MADKIFANGILYKRAENAPDYVIGSLSVKVDDFIPFLKENENKGWVNLKIMKAKSGKFYVELDTWKANDRLDERTQKKIVEVVNNDDNDSLPF